jgi:DNA replication protein DnaC
MSRIPVKIRGEWVTLPNITDQEYDELCMRAPRSLNICPTCRGKRFDGDEAGHIKSGGDHFGELNGQYKYKGVIYECDCVGQMALFRHYLASNIGEQYMRLDWTEYSGDLDAKGLIDQYIGVWPTARSNGMGVTLWGPVGVGKTFAATHIAKSLLRKGQKVWFTHFKEIVDDSLKLTGQAALDYQTKLMNVSCLVVDELYWLSSQSDQRKNLFGEFLEQVVRYRTNRNLPIILTSNLAPDEFESTYPRVFSLLEAKQWVIEMQGLDYRRTAANLENLEMTINGEVRPIV